MMFVRKNVNYHHNNYVELEKADRNAHLCGLVLHELECLPHLYEEDKVVDAGQEGRIFDF